MRRSLLSGRISELHCAMLLTCRYRSAISLQMVVVVEHLLHHAHSTSTVFILNPFCGLAQLANFHTTHLSPTHAAVAPLANGSSSVRLQVTL